jgi:hypothetical protein
VDLTDGTGTAAAASEQGQDAAILYVLACPLPGTDGSPAYLLHQVGGVDCVLGYTELPRLVDCCGPHQPWLAIRLTGLMADLRDQRLAGPVVNLPLGPEARWSSDGPPLDLAALAAAGRALGGARGSGGMS